MSTTTMTSTNWSTDDFVLVTDWVLANGGESPTDPTTHAKMATEIGRSPDATYLGGCQVADHMAGRRGIDPTRRAKAVAELALIDPDAVRAWARDIRIRRAIAAIDAT